MVLQGAEHLETGAVADMGQARIAVAAEVPLKNLAILGAVKHRAPRLELAHARRRLARMMLGHDGIVEVATAAHGVCEVDFPTVAVVDIAHGRRHAALGHHGVRFAQQRLADDGRAHPMGARLHRRAQTRAACTDDQDVMLSHDVLIKSTHPRILQSVQTPDAQRRTYTSEKPTQNRLIQAKSMWRSLSQLTRE